MAILLSGLGGLGSGGRSSVALLGLLGTTSKTVNLVLTVLLDEGDQVLDGAVTSVLNGRVLGASGVDLDGREASDGVGDIVGGGVDLGDGDLLAQLGVGVESGKFLVLGSEGLAVATPGSVVFDEDILLVVDDNVLEATANNDGNALLGLGDGLGLHAGLNLAVEDVLDELADLLGVDLLGLVVGVLGVLGDILDGEGGEVLGLEVEVAGVGTEELGVEGDDVDVTAVLLSDGTEVSGELLALLGGLGEDVSEGNTSLYVSQVSLWSL